MFVRSLIPVKEKKTKQAFCRWLLLVIVSMVMVLSLNGLGETLTPWSQAFINILSAKIYDQRGRENYTVVLFREADLIEDSATGQKLPYPVPYSKHEEILEEIARHSPKAILIDFSFLDSRQGDDVNALINKMCNLKALDIKFYLSSPNYAHPNLGLRQELFKASQNYDESSGCYRIVPVGYTPEKNGFTHSFDLLQEGNSTENSNQAIPSAPLQIYLDNFTQPAQPEKNLADIKNQYTTTMDIVWGWIAPDSNKTDKRCEQFKVSTAVLHLLKDGPLSFVRGCPYSNTISIHSMLFETSDIKHELIHQRVILYGGNFSGSNDYVRSPSNGTIPGVYLLAMVLDNLIVYGDAYKKNETHGLSALLTKPFYLDLLIVGCGVLIFMYKKMIDRSMRKMLNKIGSIAKYIYQYIRKKNGKKVNELKKQITYTNLLEDDKCNFHQLFWIFILLALTLIAFFFVDLGPRNFIALFFIIAIVTRIDKWISERVIIYKKISFNPPINWFCRLWKDKLLIFWYFLSATIFITLFYENKIRFIGYLLMPIILMVAYLVYILTHTFFKWIYCED